MSLLHLGALHPYEQALTLLLVFGPFAVLGIVVWRRSKEDDATSDPGEGEQPPAGERRHDHRTDLDRPRG